MTPQFTFADAAKIVRHQGHDPNTRNGTRRAKHILRDPPYAEPQLSLVDDLFEHARGAVTELPAEVAT